MSLFYTLLARSFTLPRHARAAPGGQAWQPPDPALSRPLRPYILIPPYRVLPLTPPDPASSWVGVPLTQCARETGDHCGRLAISTNTSSTMTLKIDLGNPKVKNWRRWDSSACEYSNSF